MEREQPDDAIILRAQRFEEPALSRVLSWLYPVVRKHVAFFVGLGGAEEDVAQEAMVQIYRALPGYAFRGSLRGWALRITSRVLYAYRRRARHRDLGLTATGSVSELLLAESPADREEALALAAALQRITPKKREAFILIDVLGLTAAEAGRALGTFANTAASRCRHARLELAALLSEPARAAAPDGIQQRAAAGDDEKPRRRATEEEE